MRIRVKVKTTGAGVRRVRANRLAQLSNTEKESKAWECTLICRGDKVEIISKPDIVMKIGFFRRDGPSNQVAKVSCELLLYNPSLVDARKGERMIANHPKMPKVIRKRNVSTRERCKTVGGECHDKHKAYKKERPKKIIITLRPSWRKRHRRI